LREGRGESSAPAFAMIRHSERLPSFLSNSSSSFCDRCQDAADQRKLDDSLIEREAPWGTKAPASPRASGVAFYDQRDVAVRERSGWHRRACVKMHGPKEMR